MMLFMPELGFGKSCHRSIFSSRSKVIPPPSLVEKKNSREKRRQEKTIQLRPYVFASMVKVTNFSLLLAPGVTLEVCRVF